jgi:probable F420-dependent oxidoreductase
VAIKIDNAIGKAADDPAAAGRAAADLEDAGYDGVWTGETNHDPTLLLAEMVRQTTRMDVGTAVMIAFARTPMLAAHTGYDLANYSGGRFILGLGSQVKPHIERRYSMEWSRPAARMREFVLALRAIWACWHDDAPLDFHGDFYTHTLMPPFFRPRRHEFGPPPIFLAGVGERMTEVAGEVADGFFIHPFTTRRYINEVTIPALLRGRSRAGASMDRFVVGGPSFVTVGRDEREMDIATEGTKAQIAFYGSTPAYRPVLERHGWGELQNELTALSKAGRWSDMSKLISDDMVREISVVGDPATVARELVAKLDGVAGRVSLYTPYQVAPGLLTELAQLVRGAAR